MLSVVILSALIGLCWNILIALLFGGSLAEAMSPGWLLGGILAGVAAGLFTIWSRRRRDGAEAFVDGLTTYYLGMVTYWASFVVIERCRLCLEAGGWTDFDLNDHLHLLLLFLTYGTFVFGIVLIPLCFVCRHLIWRAYSCVETRRSNRQYEGSARN